MLRFKPKAIFIFATLSVVFIVILINIRPNDRPIGRIASRAPRKPAPKPTITSLSTTCFPDEKSFYVELLSIFRGARLVAVLTETSDLILTKSKWDEKVANPDTTLIRLGLFGEDIDLFDEALKGLTACKKEGAPELELRIAKNYHHDGSVVNVFFILRMKSLEKVSAFMKSKDTPYFMWKRLHLRIFYLKGPEEYRYRWTGEENDDDGNFKIPAEAFEQMDNVAPLDPKDPYIVAPIDKDFFIWQKKGSEFKECNENNIKQPQTHPKGKVLKDHDKILFYMKSIMTVKQTMGKLRVFSWLNCGTLLGWWRQCSIIDNDPDIDLLHWNAMDVYPIMVKEFLDHPEIFTIRNLHIDYGPFERTPDGQEGLYLKVDVKGGQNVDLYFNYEHKLYDTRHKGDNTFSEFDWTDNVCSADLHGYLVYVPCSDNVIHRYNLLEYGKDYMKPR